MKEENDEEEIFRAVADIVSTFPINNEIIFSEIRRVMSAIKIDPALWSIYAQARSHVWKERTHTNANDLPMIIEHS